VIYYETLPEHVKSLAREIEIFKGRIEMAMNVGSYYAGGPDAVFPADRLYGTTSVHDMDNSSGLKFDHPTSCPNVAGYSSPHGFDAAALHGYHGQLHQQPAGLGFSSYSPFDSQSSGGKTAASVGGAYPGFSYAPCGQPSGYPTPGSLGGTTHSRYLHDANKFDSIAAASGNDVIAQYGGRHFGTAAMMAAAAVATMGGQHHSVGPATCPTLPIYPWMRSMGAGICLC